MDWTQVLYSDAIPWLMERSDPSVRYWTLTRLLDRPEDDAEVAEARQAIMARGPAVAILSHYAGDGRWEGERSYYTYKYTSTHWQLLLLAELAADGQDERIVAACQRMIDEVRRENRPVIWPCFHGNLVGYLHALGHGQDERVRDFEAELARAGTAGKWRCDLNGDLPCAWGAARVLWGLGRIPADERSGAVEAAIGSGVRFLGASSSALATIPAAARATSCGTSSAFRSFTRPTCSSRCAPWLTWDAWTKSRPSARRWSGWRIDAVTTVAGMGPALTGAVCGPNWKSAAGPASGSPGRRCT